MTEQKCASGDTCINYASECCVPHKLTPGCFVWPQPEPPLQAAKQRARAALGQFGQYPVCSHCGRSNRPVCCMPVDLGKIRERAARLNQQLGIAIEQRDKARAATREMGSQRSRFLALANRHATERNVAYMERADLRASCDGALLERDEARETLRLVRLAYTDAIHVENTLKRERDDALTRWNNSEQEIIRRIDTANERDEQEKRLREKYETTYLENIRLRAERDELYTALVAAVRALEFAYKMTTSPVVAEEIWRHFDDDGNALDIREIVQRLQIDGEVAE